MLSNNTQGHNWAAGLFVCFLSSATPVRFVSFNFIILFPGVEMPQYI